ncbi:MAG: hypothetical protein DRG78_15305 [Epsilonproteobacteria bacterium]|nr:MAG: hypothetical protein DRG78_15305 [Campylobacterota bacterium]
MSIENKIKQLINYHNDTFEPYPNLTTYVIIHSSYRDHKPLYIGCEYFNITFDFDYKDTDPVYLNALSDAKLNEMLLTLT